MRSCCDPRGNLLLYPRGDFRPQEGDAFFAQGDGSREGAIGSKAVDHSFRHACESAGVLEGNQGIVIVRRCWRHGGLLCCARMDSGLRLNRTEFEKFGVPARRGRVDR